MKPRILGLIATLLAVTVTAGATTVYVENLDNSWTGAGGGGVYSAYYGPPDYDDVSPGKTAVYLGREAGIIKAGITVDPGDGHYWDQGLFGFKPNVTIDAFAASTLTYNVANQTGVNPVWMSIVIDVAGTGDPTDPGNPAYQFVPVTNPAGWHTVDAGAGQWQLMDSNGNGTGPMMTLSQVAAANSGFTVIRAYLNLGMGASYNVGPGVGTVAWVNTVTLGGMTYDFVVTPVVQVENLQPDFTAVGAGGVWSAYYGPATDYDEAAPGTTAFYDGREAGIIKAGITADPGDGHYWDEGLFAFAPNVTIGELAGRTLTFDVENQTGANPVWMCIEIDTGVVGDRSDNTTFQFVPTTNPAGWHTVDGGAGQWQMMDSNGNGTGPMMSLSQIAAAYPGLNVVRTYLRLGIGDSYHGTGSGTVAWVDKATLGGVTYDFVLMTNVTGGVTVNYPGIDVPNVIGTNGALGSVLNISGGDVTAGSLLTIDGSGALGLDSGSLTTTVLANGGQFGMTGGTLDVAGVFNNAAGGMFNFSGGNANVPLLMNNQGIFTQSGGNFDPAQFTNSGTLVISGGTNVASLFLNSSSGSVTQTGGEQDVNVATNIGTWTISGGVANLTNFVNDGSATLTINGGAVTAAGSLVVNAGSAMAVSGGSLATPVLVNGGQLDMTGGTLNVNWLFTNAVGGVFNLNGGAVGSMGSWMTMDNRGTFTQSNSVFSSEDFSNSGVLTVGSGTNWTMNQFVNLAGGVVQQNGGLMIEGGWQGTTNFGTWTIAGGQAISEGGMINDNSAVLTVSGGSLEGALTVGGTGSFNQLTITNGGVVGPLNAFMIGDGILGATQTSSNNVALVSGSGSLWRNQQLVVGSYGSGNQLIINNGGQIEGGSSGGNVNAVIGAQQAAHNNSVRVTDPGSVWRNNGPIIIGQYGSANNSLTIANGGQVLSENNSGNSVIGLGGASNSVLVTGAGSLWSNQNLVVGDYGFGNSLTITNGGQVVDDYAGYLGGMQGGSSNTVLVSGSGSVWSNGVVLLVAGGGSDNKLVLTDDGLAIAHFVIIGGFNPTATGNLVAVSGGALYASDSGFGNPSLEVNGGGILALNDGSVTAGYLEVMNGGQFNMTGGTLNTVWLSNTNGGIFNLSGGNATGLVVMGNAGAWTQSGGLFGADTLGNGGTLLLNGGEQDANTAANSGAWIVNGGVANLTNFVNNGWGATLTISNGAINADGSFANLGGRVALSGGSLTTPTLLNGSQFDMTGGALNVAGSLTNMGLFNFSGGSANVPLLMNNLALFTQNGSVFAPAFFNNSGMFALSNGINSAALFVNQAGGWGQVQQSGGEQDANVATNFGTWTISGGVANLTNFVNMSGGQFNDSGTFNVSSVGTFNNVGAVNMGVLNIAAGGAVLNSGGFANGVLVNAGNFAMNAGTLNVAGAFTNSAGGVFNLYGGSASALQMENMGALTQTGGSANAMLFLNSGALMLSNGYNSAATFVNLAPGLVQQSGGYQGGNAATNLGVWAISGGMASWSSFANDGTQTISGGTNSMGQFLNSAPGVVRQSGGLHYAGMVTNFGAWTVSGGVANMGNFINDGSAALTVSGGLLYGGQLMVGGTGSFNQLIITNGGIVNFGMNYVGQTSGSSNNLAMVTGAGSVWSNSEIVVGNGGSGNNLNIANGGQVISSGASFIGNDGTNNMATIIGSGSAWTSGDLFVGDGGSGNSLTIASGGQVIGSYVSFVGNYGGNSNTATITGPGSVWNSGELFIGDGGSGNSLTIAGGGQVIGSYVSFVGDYGNSNTATITGPDSVWSIGGLYVGAGGWGNSLNVANGGRVISSDLGFVGCSGNSNTATIAGLGSVWSNALDLYIGPGGSGNKLIITNGGQVINVGVGYINYGIDSNSVLVSGSGSVWNSMAGLLLSSGAGTTNQLNIDNGGSVFTTNLVLDGDPGSTGSLVTVSGGNLSVTNGVARAILDIRNGVLTVNSGTVAADLLYATNGASSVLTLNSGSVTAGMLLNGGQFSMAGGTLSVARAFTNAVGGVFNLSGGNAIVPLQMNNMGVFTQSGGLFDPALFTNSGTLAISGGTNESALFLNLVGAVVQQSGGEQDANVATNRSTWTISGGVANLTNFVNTGSGMLTVSGGALNDSSVLNILNGALTLNGGTVTAGQFIAANGASSVVNFNSGTLASGGSMVNNGSLFTVGNGVSAATLRLLGGTHTFDNNLFIDTNATLSGSGTIIGPITDAGTIAPGYAIGTLVDNGNVTMLTGSTMAMQLAGTNSWLYDQFDVNGTFNIGGALTVSLLGYTPQSGDEFDLFDFTSYTGVFSQTNLPGLAPMLYWNTGMLYTEGKIEAERIQGLVAGRSHTVGLRGDGTLWAWGDNSNGELGDGTGVSRLTPVLVSGLSSMRAVASKDLYTVALRSDGTVWAWGYNASGQLGDGTTTDRLAPVQVGGLTNATAITAGYHHTLAVRLDGTVWAWGDNSNGQLGDGTVWPETTPVQVSGLTNAVAVAAGRYHSVALKTDGTVWTWGYNSSGQLGNGTTTDQHTPVQVSGLSGVVAVAAGVNCTVALKADGTVWGWGENDCGQLGNNTTSNQLTPVQAAGVSNVTAIAVGSTGGSTHTEALKSDRTVWSWGANESGQLGDGTKTERHTAVQVTGFSGGVLVAAGMAHSAALRTDGTVWSWGGNGSGQLGDGTMTARLAAVEVSGLNIFCMPAAVTLAAAGVTSSAATLQGAVVANGLATTAYFQYGATTNYGTVTSLQSVGSGNTNAPVTALVTGLSPYGVYHYQTVATNLSGTGYGADMVFTNSGVPPVIATGSQLIGAAAGNVYNLALTATGGLTNYSWSVVSGSLPAGLSLGSASGIISGTPTAAGPASFSVRVMGADGLASTKIFSMPVFSFALGSWLPGGVINSSYSQTLQVTGGTGPYTWSSTGTLPPGVSLSSGGVLSGTPTAGGTYNFTVQVTDSTGQTVSLVMGLTVGSGGSVPSIVAGRLHTVALRGDGTVWTWGDNSNGELGDGTGVSRLTPTLVSGLSLVRAVAAKDLYTVALKADGTVWAWGYNSSGQLGDGTKTQRLAPVQVSGLNDVTAITAGYYHTLAVRADGTVWAWGNNSNGQLGDGTTWPETTPVQVSGLSGVVAVAAGQYHSVALKSDGTVWTWGYNGYGQLGDGTATEGHAPVQVSGLSGVVAVAAGVNCTVVLKSDGTVWGWGENSNGQLGDGTTTMRLVPVQAAVAGVVTAIAVGSTGGSTHTEALKSNGTVWSWGANESGQLGDGTKTEQHTAVQVNGFGGGVAVAAGMAHSAALKSDGTVWSWGGNGNGQLGDGTTTTRLAAVGASGLNLLCMPAASTLAAAGVTSSTATLQGTVNGNGQAVTGYFRWGTTTNYSQVTSSQLVGGGSTNVTLTAPVTGLSPYAVYHYQAVATNSLGAGYGADMVFTASGMAPVFTTGSQLVGAGTGNAYTTTLAATGGLTNYSWSVASGSLPAGLNLTATNGLISGTPTAAGASSFGVRVMGSDGLASTNTFSLTVFSFALGSWLPGGVTNGSYNVTLQVTGGTGPYTWSSTGTLPTGLSLSSAGVLSGTPTVGGTYPFTIQVTDSTGATASQRVELTVGSGVPIPSVAAGRSYTVALKASDGTLWAWGDNEYGQLGDGTTTGQLVPEQLGLTGVKSVAAKDLYTVALKADGTVWAWGYNTSGQLGDGTKTTRLAPVQVSGLNGATAIAAGYYHTLAVRADGTVWAWGNNSNGQLGDGTTWPETTPVQVSGLSGVMAVAAGRYHSVALKTDGTVWTWGYNASGQLGDGTITERHAPAQVSGLSGVVAVAAGVNCTVVLKADGTVWGWGENNNGQLGDGTTTNRLTPVQAMGLTGTVTAIAVGSTGGSTHTEALKSDGTVWSWGANESGQLGDGTKTERHAPVQVSAFSGLAPLAAGTSHTVIMGSNQFLWAWGGNGSGQLGDATTTMRLAPVEVDPVDLLDGPGAVTLAATGVSGSDTATLNGSVNPNGVDTTAYFQWGTTASYGSFTTPQSVGSGAVDVPVAASLTGLAPNAVYHYQVVASSGGQFSYGADMVFTNSAASAAPTAVQLAAASDTGASNSDSLTDLDNSTPAKTLTFHVTGTVTGATVSLYDGATAIGSATASGTATDVTTSGTAVLASGAHSIVARQTQSGMLESDASPAVVVTIDTASPTITAVVSRKVHGSAGTFDLPLAFGSSSTATVEPRNGGPTQIVFTFSKNIAATALGAGNFTIANATYSSATIVGSALTLNLSGVVDTTTVTVALSGITDLAGNALGGTTNLSVRALYGDVNQNGTVNAVDMQQLKNNLMAAMTSANFLYDVNCSGGINAVDLQQTKNNLMHSASIASGSVAAPTGSSSAANSSLTSSASSATALGVALGATNLIWSTDGDAGWTATIAEDGSKAAWSGSIGNLNVSWLETTVTAAGTLSFDWMVSSELNGDCLTFAIDGVTQPGAISGEVGWQTLTYTIPAGTHRLTWTYSKNGATAAGLDAGWLRRVVYSQAP